MAEYLFRSHVLSENDVSVCSAGVMAGFGAPASRYALQALDELGVDARPHRSQPVTPDLVHQAEMLVVMTSQHRDILLERHPDVAPRLSLLKAFDDKQSGEDVMDPIGLSLDVYRYVRDDIAAALWGLNAHLQRTALPRKESD